MGKSKLSIKYSIQILNVKFVAKNYKIEKANGETL